MDQERQLLMTNSKEWLVQEIITQRERHHLKMVSSIKFTQGVLSELHTLTAKVKGFLEFGIIPNEWEER
jgi:hypothetical protein